MIYKQFYGLMLQRGLCTCTIIPDVKSGCGILDNSYDKDKPKTDCQRMRSLHEP